MEFRILDVADNVLKISNTVQQSAPLAIETLSWIWNKVIKYQKCDETAT